MVRPARYALLLLAVGASVLPGAAVAEQASEPGSPAAGQLAVGLYHSCALLAGGQVRCWGFNSSGQLGYGSTSTVGATQTPASVGPVDLGAGRSATEVSAGDVHTCALLDNRTVLCWGFGGDGRLGYGNTSNIGDKQTPGSVGPVSLGGAAKAITAGGAHTCAILNDGSVRCWGFGGAYQMNSGGDGRLGYGNTSNVGDTPATTPDKEGPVYLGTGRTAVAISAGNSHTCAILDNGDVLCWGFGADGRLGYGDTNAVGSTPQTLPGNHGVVPLGGHKATAISAGDSHTCAILDDGSVRCWGFGGNGELGYGNPANAGNTPATTPDKEGAVYLGANRHAVAISAGGAHTCAILDNGSVLCWGYAADGRLGYGNTSNAGDTPATTPGQLGPVDLGSGRTAVAISAGGSHTCAQLDNGAVRCWGYGGDGRLGYCNENDVGNSLTPGSAGPVNLLPGDGGVPCAPVNLSVPSISGRAVERQTLTEAHGSWTNNPTSFSYQWLDCDAAGNGCRAISGAIGQSYTLTGSDAAHTVRVQEVASNAGGSGSPAISAPTGVLPTAPAEGSRPAISGQTRVGRSLSASTGKWSGTPPLLFSYQWQRCHLRCTKIAGARRSSYKLTVADAGATMLVTVTATNVAGHASADSARVGPVADPAYAARARGWRSCVGRVTKQARRERAMLRRASTRKRAQAKRQLDGERRHCLRVYARTPGSVSGLRAITRGKHRIELDFTASGTDGTHPPPAHRYLVKQSLAPIRTRRDFTRAQALCAGACSFRVTQIGAKITLTITQLHAHTTYYYVVAALDNITATAGPRTRAIKARTR